MMMGMKERRFAQFVTVSLEDLVPADHFYRHLERTLDVSFVREFVQEKYAGKVMFLRILFVFLSDNFSSGFLQAA